MEAKAMTVAFATFWIVAVIVGLAFYGTIIWGIIELVRHFA